MTRRTFLSHTIAASAALGTGVLASAQTAAVSAGASGPAPVPPPAPGTEPKRPAPLEPKLVQQFVGVGHNNLPRVVEMLAAEPMLINAEWDWGGGDWETALGGASHTGHDQIALHLLDHGARFDAFCAAMLGETDLVTAMLRAHPALANARGPHGYTLLYHSGYSGRVPLAEAIASLIAADRRARHFNQALETATVRGHTELVAYLLEHGVDNPNGKNFQGKTPLDVARARSFDAIAELLRAHGGLTTS